MTRDELRTIYERAMRYDNEDAAVSALTGLMQRPKPNGSVKPSAPIRDRTPIQNGKVYRVTRRGKRVETVEV